MTKASRNFFYLLCIVLIVVISIWGVLFNKAYLLVQAEDDIPFLVNVGNSSITCTEQCSIELTPGSYNVLVTRDGYAETRATIYLSRGRTQEITYNPVFLPVFEQVDSSSITDIDLFLFEQTTDSQQVFQLFTGEEYRPVSTFRSPLNNPMASLSFDMTTAFIWSESEYYLVDTLNESRNRLNLNLPTNTTPDNFRLLTNSLLLVQIANQVYLYNLESNNYLLFPVNSVDHVVINYQGTDQTNLVLFSSRNLASQRGLPSGVSNTLTQLIEDIDQDNEDLLPEQIVARPDKIFLYNTTSGSFTFLGLVPDFIVEPMQFETVLVNQQLEVLLTTQQEYYQMIISKN